MNRKKYLQIRVIVSLFVLLVIVLSVLKNSYLLSLIGVLTGLIFSVFIQLRAKPLSDERQIFLHQKAAQTTYAIFTPTLAITSAILLFPTLSHLSVFSRGEFVFIDAIGTILAYLSLFLIIIYAISFYWFNKKY